MKHSKNIKKAISSFLFKSTFIFVGIEIIIIIIYFLISGQLTKQIIGELEAKTYNGIVNELKHELDEVELKIDSIITSLMGLKNEHDYFFKHMHIYNPASFNIILDKTEGGMLYKSVDNGGASLYISSKEKFTEPLINKAYLSEVLDGTLKFVVDHNSFLLQAYFNSDDNMVRMYPYRPVEDINFTESYEIKDFDFYNLALLANNPEKTHKWTSVYLDPVSGGWILSCIVPIYNDQKLEGVTGVDITIEKLISEIMDLNLEVNSSILVTDNTGSILAFDHEAEILLGLQNHEDHKDLEPIDKTIYKPREFNIFNYLKAEAIQTLMPMFDDESDKKYEIMNINNKDYYTLVRKINETKWHVFIFTEKEKVLYNTNLLRKNAGKLLTMVTLSISVVFLMIYVILHFRIKRISKKISEPIYELSEQTKILGKDLKEVAKIKDSGIQEIDILNHNFYKMVRDIKYRTEKIVMMKVEEEKYKIEIQERVIEATTDSLTKIYNRRKIEDELNQEISRSQRYGTIFSIILIDIDNFKFINDHFGHERGDEILINTALVIKNSIRESDILARWGGDEFLVLILESDENDAFRISQKIRDALKTYTFTDNINVTISGGIAEMEDDIDTTKSLLKKADLSLYAAKKRGRNTVIKYNEIRNDPKHGHESDKK